MEVIFLIGTAQAFFLAFLAITKKNKSVRDYVLASWMASVGWHLLGHYIHATGLANSFPHLLWIAICFPMLEGPFMFVYVLTIVSETNKFKLIYLFNALPFLIFTIYLLFDFYFLSAPEKVEYVQNQAVNFSFGRIGIIVLNTFLGPIYLILSLIKLRKHRRNIAEQFSYTEQINLNWLRTVLGGLGLVWVVVIAALFLRDLFPIITMKQGDNIIYLAVTAVVFFMSYYGLRQPTIYTSSVKEMQKSDVIKKASGQQDKSEKYLRSGLREDTEGHLTALIEYLKKEKPFLENKLSLPQLAERLELSTNQLSQLINEKLKKNFFDFINSYRVEEFKHCLIDSEFKNFSLLGVAYECGFNSKSSFNRIFKENTGLTPSEYQKSIKA